MSETKIPDSVLARVRKLLAMAERSEGNENEASVAAAKAQEILAEYNLEMSELDAGSGPQSEDASREKDERAFEARADWQVTLMSAIAETNFCKHWTNTVYSKRLDGKGSERKRRIHCLIGRRVNIVVVKEMYVYLSQAMERLCPYEDRRDRSSKSWFQGCSDRLRSRLAEQRAASEAASRKRQADPARGSGTDLVLSDVFSSEEDLNNDFAYGYAPGTTAARRREREAANAAAMEEYRRRRAEQPVTVVEAKAESEKDRLKRERADARWYESYQRRQAREAARVDQHAYRAGSDTGRDIGLDRQVAGCKASPRLG